MENMYIIRKVSGAGYPNKNPYQVSLPADWLKWQNNKRGKPLTQVKITIEGDKLILEPYESE